jgi:hypothetical protein
MATLQLVYVHGAGPQKPAADLKNELDQIVFGHKMTTTLVAYYANVRWPAAGGPAIGGRVAAGGRPTGRAARDKAISTASSRRVPPKVAAEAIVAATLAGGARSRSTAGRASGRAVGRAPSGPTAKEARDAVKLVEKLYAYADRVAERSASGRQVAGITFPDWIFRRVVGRFASDVVDYLYGGFTEQMRAPVRQTLLTGSPPGVIVAHSLGTIIVYDVLSEPAFSGLDVKLLVTAGCPLGIGNVQNRLRDAAGRPNPVPSAVKAWVNFGDRFDPVALDATLRDEFSPPKNFATDEEVNNPAKNNHDLTGYLAIEVIRSSIVAAAGQ